MSGPASSHRGPKLQDLESAIRRRVLARDVRYDLGAYLFLYEALAYTQRRLGRADARLSSEDRHVTGQELVRGIRALAADQFGPLAPTVFRIWGLECTRDFGQIVFNLVESELLGKTEEDTIDDFADGFDFNTAFEEPPELDLA
jgi:uncharacterized repeat protein (TIGR04138 family)